MVKKSKSTKQVRAIDRIIKFQIDDGLESLTISGKEVLADVSIDRKANVTLFLNADPDKINEIQSLVPFINLDTVAGGSETDKTKVVTLSQDLTQFAIEIADNSDELATLIKTKSSIELDLSGLVQKLFEIAGKLAELERKNQEQDDKIVAIEAKNESQDDRLNEIGITQEAHTGKLIELERVNTEQTSKIGLLENNLATVDQNQENQASTLTEHDERLRVLEAGGGSEVPAESKFIGHLKLQQELDGENPTDFVFEEIPVGSIIFLSINYENGGVPYVFTRSFAVYEYEYLLTKIGSSYIYIEYGQPNRLTVSFENSAMGPAVVDVTYIKPEGYADGIGYINNHVTQM